MPDWVRQFSASRRGFVQRTAGALLLCALFGLLLIIPSVSSETATHLHNNTPLYSHWQEGELSDDGFDDDIAGGAADFSVGSFALHRPQSELFMKGLLGEVYDIASGAAVEGSDLENYLQSRARAQVMNTEVPDFKNWLSSRKQGITDRIFLASADYLTDYLTAAAVDNAERLNFVRTIEWDYQSSLGDRRWQTGISALGALRESADDAVAWQLRGYAAEDSGTGANAGLIYRRAVDAGTDALVGANVFLDYEEHGDYDDDFLRWSLGGEYRNAYVDIYLNRYFPISDAVLRDGDYVYTQGGQEAYINLKAPDFGVGEVSGGLTHYRWEGEYGNADDKGFRYHVRVSPRLSNWRFELELDSPDGGDADWGGQVSYRHIIGSAKTGYGAISTQTAFDAQAHFFDVVRREYAQRIRNSNDAARIVVVRLLDNPDSTAEVAALDIFTAASATDPATEVTLAAGETTTLSLLQTVSITVGADSTLALSASNWLVTVYEESAVRLLESGGELEVASGTVSFERSGNDLTSFLVGGTRIALLGTQGEAGVNYLAGSTIPAGEYGAFIRLTEGTVALTLASTTQMSVEVVNEEAETQVVLLPSFFEDPDDPTTPPLAEPMQLTVGCASASQRDAHRIVSPEGFTGCVGDVRMGGLDEGEEVILHTQGDTLTLRGVASFNTAGDSRRLRISVVNARGAANPLLSNWDAYPFHSHASTLEVKDDAVELSYGQGAGAAALTATANSTVAFSFIDPAAGATATAAVSIYAAVINDGISNNGAISGVGTTPEADTVGCADGHLIRSSEGLVSVVAVCGAPSFEGGSELEITGSTGTEQMIEVEVSKGGGAYRFELVGDNPALALASPTGTVAILALFSDRPISDAKYQLRAVPLPPSNAYIGAAEIDIVVRVVDTSVPLLLSDPSPVDELAAPHAAGDVLFAVSGSGGDSANYAYSFESGDSSVLQTVLSGANLQFQLSSPVASGLPRVLSVTVELNDGSSAAVSREVSVTLLAPLSLPEPAAVNGAGVVESASSHTAGKALFVLAAGGGDGAYTYAIDPALTGADAVIELDENTAALSQDVEVEAGEKRRIELTIAVTDGSGSTAATRKVTVDLLSGLLLSDPSPVDELVAPHAAGDVLFAVSGSGGDSANYAYSFESGDSGVLQTVLSGANLQFQLSSPVASGLPRVLLVTVELNDGSSAAVSQAVSVTLLAPLSLPVPAAVNGAGVVESASSHTAGKALFVLAAGGGDGAYTYAIDPALTGADAVIELDENTAALSQDVEVEAGEKRRIELTIAVTDGSGSTAATRKVTVDLLSGLLLSDPSPVAQLVAPHAAGDVLFAVSGSGGDSANYAYSFESGDSGVLQTVLSGANLQFQLSSPVASGLPRVLSVTVELNDGSSAAVSQAVSVTLLAPLSLPEPAAVNGAGVVESASSHTAGKALFVLAAGGGDGDYTYAIEPALTGADAVIELDENTAQLSQDVEVEAGEKQRIELTIAVTDGSGSTAATRKVTVDLLSQVSFTNIPTAKIERTVPPAAFNDVLHTFTAEGGTEAYVYSIEGVAPPEHAGLVAFSDTTNGALLQAQEITPQAFPPELAVTVKVTDADETLGSSRIATLTISWGAPQPVNADKHLYILGGRSGASNNLNEIWASNQNDESSWERIPSSMPVRQNHAAAVLGGTIFISGGRSDTGSGGGTIQSDVWASGDNGVSWSQVATDIGAREGHAMVNYGGTLHIIGGSNTNILYSSGDGKNWTHNTGFSGFTTRRDMAVVEHEGELYVIGGAVGNALTRTVAIYKAITVDVDSTKNFPKFTEIVQPEGAVNPPRRDRAQAVSFAGRIYLIGGRPAGAAADVWSSEDGATWRRETPEGENPEFGDLRQHVAYVKGISIFVVGGRRDDTALNVQNAVWASADGKTWEEVSADSGEPGFGARFNAAGVLHTPREADISGPAAVADALFPSQAFRVAADGSLASGALLTVTVLRSGFGTPVYEITPEAARQYVSLTTGGASVKLTVVQATAIGAARQLEFAITMSDDLGEASFATAVQWVERDDFSAVNKDADLFVIGGDGLSDVWVSSDDGATWRWLTQKAAFGQRAQPAVAALDGTVYVSGGRQGAGAAYFTDVWASENGVNWSRSSAENAFTGRFRHAMLVNGGTLYIIGGETNDGANSTYLNDIWHSDANGGALGANWDPVAASGDVFSGRSGFAAFVHEGNMFVAGGQTGASSYSDEVWASSDGAVWTLQGSLPADFSRVDLQGISFQGRIYLSGGADADGGGSDEVWSSVDGKSWSRVTDAAQFGALSGHRVVAQGDTPAKNKMFALAGAKADGSASNEVWSSNEGASWTIQAQQQDKTLPARVNPGVAAFIPSGLGLVAPARFNVLSESGTFFTLDAFLGDGNYRYARGAVTPDTFDSALIQVAPSGEVSGAAGLLADLVATENGEITVEFSVTDSNGTGATDTAAVVLWAEQPPLALPPPPTQNGVVHPPVPHTAGTELFVAAASGGEGNYSYEIVGDNANIGIDASSGSVTIKAEVSSPQEVEIVIKVTDKNDDGTVAGTVDITVTVNLSPPQQLVNENGLLYMIGGSDSSGHLSDVWVANREKNGWTAVQGSRSFSPRRGHEAAVLGGTIFISGGNGQSDVWASGDNGVKWSQVAVGIVGSSGHAMVNYGGTLHIISGGNGGLSSSGNGENWTPNTDFSGFSNRSGMAVVEHKGDLYVIGGHDGASRTAEVYKTTKNTFPVFTAVTQVGDVPPARNSAQAVSFAGRIYLIGGAGAADVWSSADGATWRRETATPAFGNLRHHVAYVQGVSIFVAGGNDSGGGGRVNAVWSSANGKDWDEVAVADGNQVFSPRQHAAGVVHTPQNIDRVAFVEDTPTEIDRIIPPDGNAAGVALHTFVTELAMLGLDTANYSYSIASGNTGNVVALDSASGELTQAQAVDPSSQEDLVLEIVVTDSATSLSDTVTVTVRWEQPQVIFAESTPTEIDQTIPPSENAAAGVTLHTFAAVGGSSAANYSYSIASGNTGNAVALDSASGELTQAQAVDLSSREDLVLEIVVTDSVTSLSDTVTVTVSWRALQPVNENGFLYMIGGIISSGDALSDVWVANLEKDGWTAIQGSHSFSPRHVHAAAVLGGTIFISGGARKGGRFGDVWASGDNGVNWSQVATNIGERGEHAMVNYGGTLHIIGGNSGGGGILYSSGNGETWTPNTGFSGFSHRRNMAVVEHKGDLYVIGGYTDLSNPRTTEVYKTTKATFPVFEAVAQTADNHPPARSNARAVSFAGRIYLVGGDTGSGTTDVWSSADGATWRRETAAPEFGNLRHHVAYVQGVSMFVAGGINGAGRVNAVWSSANGKTWERVEAVAGNQIFSPRSGTAGVVHTPRVAFAEGTPTQINRTIPSDENAAGAVLHTFAAAELAALGLDAANYSYSIASGNTGNVVVLDSASGELTQAQAVDPSSQEDLVLEIVVTDSATRSSDTVTVTVSWEAP